MGNGSFNEAQFATTSLGVSDEVSLTRGNHQIAFGANAWTWRHKQRAHSASLGMYTFDGTATGLGMGDFLTGQTDANEPGLHNAVGHGTVVFRRLSVRTSGR